MKLTEIKLNPKNPRKIEKHKITKLAESIKDFPKMMELRPIVVDKKNVILGGNMRFQALQIAGYEEIPDEWVRVADKLTAAEKKRFILEDNIAFGSWDWSVISEDYKLDDLKIFGFEDDELNKHLDFTKDTLEDDELPEEVKPITKQGDLWELGKHRVLCGDSTDAEQVGSLMTNTKANIAFTSPPYNVGAMNIKGNKATEAKYNKCKDTQSKLSYWAFICANMELLIQYADEVFYNIGLVENNKVQIFNIVNKYGRLFKDVIYWKKDSVAPHIQKGVVNNKVEFILCFGNGQRKFINAQFGQGTYWNVIEGGNAAGNEYADIHKATFPVYLPLNILQNFTSKKGTVYDSFLGTGSTLIACEKTNRICYGMEIDEHYCDVIVKRYIQWCQTNNITPKVKRNGKAFNIKDI